MAHFAKIESGIVATVIVADQAFVDTQPGTWVQTSYNTRGGKHYAPNSWTEDEGTPLRKNFAQPGDTYDSSRDAFYEPQPTWEGTLWASWILNETTCKWEPPVAHPDDGKMYAWDEDAYQADNSAGWVFSAPDPAGGVVGWF